MIFCWTLAASRSLRLPVKEKSLERRNLLLHRLEINYVASCYNFFAIVITLRVTAYHTAGELLGLVCWLHYTLYIEFEYWMYRYISYTVYWNEKYFSVLLGNRSSDFLLCFLCHSNHIASHSIPHSWRTLRSGPLAALYASSGKWFWDVLINGFINDSLAFRLSTRLQATAIWKQSAGATGDINNNS